MKIFEFPKSETLSAWICFALCGLLGALSVGSWNLILLISPLYILIANSSVVGLILFARARK